MFIILHLSFLFDLIQENRSGCHFGNFAFLNFYCKLKSLETNPRFYCDVYIVKAYHVRKSGMGAGRKGNVLFDLIKMSQDAVSKLFLWGAVPNPINLLTGSHLPYTILSLQSMEILLLPKNIGSIPLSWGTR